MGTVPPGARIFLQGFLLQGLFLPAVLVLAMVLQGCTHASYTPAYPTHWYQPVPAASSECTLPTGEFANQGGSSDPDFPAPPLASMLFEDKLAGFPIESVRISHNPDNNSLVFQGVLAGVPLKQHKTIIIDNRDCDASRGGETHSGAVNASLRTEAVLLTGGLFVPLSEKYKFQLQLLQDGALLVQLDVRARVLGGLMIPLSFNNNYWLRYGRYQPETNTAETSAPATSTPANNVQPGEVDKP